MIHTGKGFGVVDKAEIDVFLEPSCFAMIQWLLANWQSLKFLRTFWSVVKITQLCLSCDPIAYTAMEFSRPEYWSWYFSLFQGVFPSQGSNPGVLHCRQIFYQLSHKGSLIDRVTEEIWVEVHNTTHEGEEKQMQKCKIVGWGGLTNCWEKRSKRQRRKGKINLSECRVPKNNKKR